ncbi:hypothetical protein Tco_1043008 [Tanacetum coccineum]|uniref:Uncharacterized protein n=1 Tax=Tanacetum coccineum TaxID=301880 RepID=A0ABQ5GNE4_9ASTR
MRRHLLTTESIRPVNPNIDLTAERLGLSPVMTKTDPQVTPPSQEYLQNRNVPNLVIRLRLIACYVKILTKLRSFYNEPVNASIDVTGGRTTVPISIVFDRFRSLKKPKIQSNSVADTADTSAYMDLADCDK